jgi:hypothetical protein
LPAADVLAQAVPRDFDDRMYRVALTLNEIDILRQCIDSQDPLAFQEATTFFQLEESDLPALLDGPFTAKSIGEGKPFRQSRFSDGSYAVFYSAQEPGTAGQEYAHNAPTYIPETMGTVTFQIHLIDCRVLGTLPDLRPLTKAFPQLIAHEHSFCREVGANVVTGGIDGLLATSVRQPDGTNAAIFKRVCLSDPRHIGLVMCTVDAVAKKATYNIVV